MNEKEKTIQRLYGLLELQKDMEKQFSDENYNIFIFGSYVTMSYVEGFSDIDIAVYTEEFDLYKKISLYLENYFNRMNIKSDIFYIDTNIIAPLYCAPLSSQIQFTEYFPDKLKDFHLKCEAALQSERKKVAV